MAASRRPSTARLAGAALVGYLAGTAPSADVAARVASKGAVDIRATGTGNPGTANAMKVLGTRWGLAVMVADIAKGAAATRVGGRIAGDLGAHVAGTAAVVGHCHPVWTGFRGGKGVAASVGQVLGTFPAYFPFDVVIAGLSVSNRRWRRRALTTTAISCAGWVLSGVLWWRRGLPNRWGPTPTAALPVAAAVSSAVIIGRFLAAGPTPEAAAPGDEDPGRAAPGEAAG